MKRAVLVTGAAGGIGAAIVTAFSGAGWRVIATDKTGDGGDVFINEDLALFTTEPARLSAFAKKARGSLADAPLSCIVNNAAVQNLGRLDALSIEAIAESFNVNVIAPMLLAKTFLRELEGAKGSVINIGSVHAQATKPEFSAYAASKAAIHGLTRALAVDLAPRVRVNTLAPAATATEMLKAGFEGDEDGFDALKTVHPAGRIATPEEIAKIAVFLASDDSAFMTGATVYADGGVLSRLHDPA